MPLHLPIFWRFIMAKYKGLMFNVVRKHLDSRTSGIYRISHYLREQGLDIEVIDFANYWSLDELKTLFISRYSSDLKFIGFSYLFNIWDINLEEFCQWIKKNYPDVIIISGGPTYPRIESNNIDYYLYGYAELGITRLLSYLFSNGTMPKMKVVDNKKILDCNKDHISYPMNSLMIKYEDRDFLNPHEWVGIEFSRGCKFKCKFCNFPVLGVKGDYSRDADDFEMHLRYAYDQYGISNYVVEDETFNDTSEKITKFANVVQQLDFDPWFSGFIRPDLLVSRPDDKKRLLDMNFYGHFYGVESFNNQSAKTVGKGMDTDKLLSGLVEVKDFFLSNNPNLYRGSISIIVGLPHDSFENISFTKSWLIDNWQGQSFNAYPLKIEQGQYQRKSIIDLDYEKYGYNEMSNTEIEKYKNDVIYSRVYDHFLKEDDEVAWWENENMNMFQAGMSVYQLHNDTRDSYDFRLGVFALGQVLEVPLSLSDKLKLTYNDLEVQRATLGFVHNYIHQKLSI